MHKITSFIVAEISKVKKGKELPAPTAIKSSPHYLAKSMPPQIVIGKEKVKVENHEVELILKSYYSDALMIEGSIDIEDIFSEEVLDLKDKLLDACFEYGKKNGAKMETSEEFTVYQVSGYTGDPELFLKKHPAQIASLLKSEKLELDEKEIEYTLSFQFKYVKDDLIILDWDGAVLFDPNGDFEESIDLLQLANFQLLRYRAMDEDLDGRLKKVYKLIQPEEKKSWWSRLKTREMTQAFKEVIHIRTQSIAQFEALDRDIKLIGDWYSARVYSLLSKKFKFDDWHNTIKEKLDSLEDIYSIASENLGMSRTKLLERIEIIGFIILQIGWIPLLYFEFTSYIK
ncbi:MAG: hypothetical protein Q7S81_01395 [bacterium]|nr:hypothetical protein [bacterium]